ncbi:MAG: glycosyltransferase family 2 protein [Phycisphaerales bacterium]
MTSESRQLGPTGTKPSLVIALTCKSNERTIGSTLSTVRRLLERSDPQGVILAYDSGSTDRTMEMLRDAGAMIVSCVWEGYIKTSQRALQHASELVADNGWVFCVESDESLDDELIDSIASLIRDNPADVIGANVNRRVIIAGRMLKYAWQPEWRLRIARPGRAAWGGTEPHSAIFAQGRGRIIKLRGNMIHASFHSLEEHLTKCLRLASIAARTNPATGKRTNAVRLLISATGCFLKHYILKRGFLDGTPGLLASASMTCYTLMKHVIWLEAQTVKEPR